MTGGTRVPPTFFVVGAPRCGTTSLHYYLPQHPSISVSSVKEPNFFLFDHRNGEAVPLVDDERIQHKSVSSPDEYARLFPTTEGEVGEVSPLYLYTRETPALIARGAPGSRAVAVLRDPTLRSWSHFQYSYEGDPRDAYSQFERAIAPELADASYSPYRTGTHFLRVSLYHRQVERYVDTFGADRVLIVLYDELESAPQETLSRICSFLGVEPVTFDVKERYNRSGLYESAGARRARRPLRKAQPYIKKMLPPRVAGSLARARARWAGKGAHALPLRADIEARLREFFAPDVEALARLIGRDLDGWITGPR